MGGPTRRQTPPDSKGSITFNCHIPAALPLCAARSGSRRCRFRQSQRRNPCAAVRSLGFSVVAHAAVAAVAAQGDLGHNIETARATIEVDAALLQVNTPQVRNLSRPVGWQAAFL